MATLIDAVKTLKVINEYNKNRFFLSRWFSSGSSEEKALLADLKEQFKVAGYSDEMIEKLKNGDQKAFEDFEKDLKIRNDTYMGAWNAIPPTIPKSLKYFLVKIARNLSLDRLEYMTAGKRKSIIVEIDEAIPDAKNTPEEAWELKEVGMAINTFLGTLDQKACAVFLARYYYGYSIADLADKYGMSQRQVKYSLKKTRDKLRTHLEKEGVVL